MTKIADLKKRRMKNVEFRKEYEQADAEFSIIEAFGAGKDRSKALPG